MQTFTSYMLFLKLVGQASTDDRSSQASRDIKLLNLQCKQFITYLLQSTGSTTYKPTTTAIRNAFSTKRHMALSEGRGR